MYIYMEAGHIAENVQLQAVALGLGAVPMGAFDEALVSKALAIPRGEQPLYLITIGQPDQGAVGQ